MIHRRNPLASNQQVPKAPATGHGGWSDYRKSMAGNKVLIKSSWKKELERAIQDPLSSMPKALCHGTKTRCLFLATCIFALVVSLTCFGFCLVAWVDSWATSVSKALAVVPDALVSDPPLIPGVPFLPYNDIYHIPESHPQMGDRSDKYAVLREKVDRILPFSPSRSLKFVQELRQTNYSARAMSATENPTLQDTYNIYNCPLEPPIGYPFVWPLVNLLTSWPPKDTSQVPERPIFQGLCLFQFPRDLQKALVYRHHEVPFVMQGDPHIARTVERWNLPGYLSTMLNGKRYRTEHSKTNHFLYRRPGSRPSPDGTQLKWLTYEEWLARANVTEDLSGPNHEHWYFRLIGCGALQQSSCDKRTSTENLFDELPFLQPTWQARESGITKSTQLYMGDEGDQQKGLHCRFGMRGVIAENHYDTDRNVIVVLGGSRRYILAHPSQCQYMSLYPPAHPSARQSGFDWSTGDASSFPRIFVENAKGNEVVLQAGDALYLPTYYFHYIVSLDLNMQCNTRSGLGKENAKWIEEC